jgi:hypothetical protein
VWQRFCDRFLKRPLLTVSRSFINVGNSVLWRMAIILKASKVNLFVSSVLFVFWYLLSPTFLDTSRKRTWSMIFPRELCVSKVHTLLKYNEFNNLHFYPSCDVEYRHSKKWVQNCFPGGERPG